MINFILGLIIGGLIGIGIMCLLQINRDNKAQRRIDKAIEYIENEGEHTDCSGEPIYYLDEEQEEELLEILGGDVDDEI